MKGAFDLEIDTYDYIQNSNTNKCSMYEVLSARLIDLGSISSKKYLKGREINTKNKP